MTIILFIIFVFINLLKMTMMTMMMMTPEMMQLMRKSQMAEECEEEKRRRLEEQFVWPDSPRLSYNGEEDHKNDYDDNYEKKTKTAKLSR